MSGSTLYGMTNQGGASDLGTVFKVNTDGTGYALLRSFAGGAADGSSPQGSLAVSGSTLYGMTYLGGASNLGTVFKVNTDGTGYVLLRSFAGGTADGGYPYGSLAVSGSTLYGMTYLGGASNLGTVFKVNTDGTGYALLRSFAGGTADGRYPYGSLVLSGSTLYGMTIGGGASSVGTVFKVNTDGTGYALLRSFAGGTADGRSPYGSLAVSGSTLYGMTNQGGASDRGTVFKVNTDGTGYALLRSFAGGAADGRSPYGSLAVSGSTLYGMTNQGGAFNLGTVFKVNTDGTGYALLRSFAGGTADGGSPLSSLAVSDSTLYGMTPLGGASDRGGTVFRVVLACSVNEHVSANACVACAAGSTRTAGDDPGGANTSCTATVCGANEYVSSNACVACAPGSTRPAGDLATGANTACTATVCSENQYVSSNACVACAPGSTRPAGDLATGANTSCTATVCGANQYVSNHACVACAPGGTRPAGDLATGANTACTAAVCGANEYVSSNACVACAPGSTRPAGDVATGADTSCAATVCGVNEYVSNHACVECAAGGTRPAGDLATGANTACANTVCGVNEYVSSHTCTACAPGSTRAAGDLATGADTTCAATLCAANEHVSSNACVPCAPGSTRAAGDVATGADTACATTVCAANEHVVSHACVACAAGTTRPAGDVATGADTACSGSSTDSGAPSGGDAGSTSNPGVDASASSSSGSGGSDASMAPTSGAPEDDSGCSVGRTGTGRPTTAGFGALGALVLVGLRRRRRAAA
ncbi:MAG: hypothetical protein KF795_13340 [Labilithrix sp.]|nr:hypothetical protein [Labilithrix sp.]